MPFVYRPPTRPRSDEHLFVGGVEPRNHNQNLPFLFWTLVSLAFTLFFGVPRIHWPTANGKASRPVGNPPGWTYNPPSGVDREIGTPPAAAPQPAGTVSPASGGPSFTLPVAGVTIPPGLMQEYASAVATVQIAAGDWRTCFYVRREVKKVRRCKVPVRRGGTSESGDFSKI